MIHCLFTQFSTVHMARRLMTSYKCGLIVVSVHDLSFNRILLDFTGFSEKSVFWAYLHNHTSKVNKITYSSIVWVYVNTYFKKNSEQVPTYVDIWWKPNFPDPSSVLGMSTYVAQITRFMARPCLYGS